MNFHVLNRFDDKLGLKKNIILWNSTFTNPSKNIISIVNQVEVNNYGLRDKFYDFIYGISKKKVGNKTLEDFLVHKNEFSYLWYTSLFQRDIYDYYTLNDLIKCFALIDFIRVNKIKKIDLSFFESNLSLFKQIEKICENLKVKVIFIRRPHSAHSRKFLKITANSLIYLFYFYFIRFNFRKNRLSNSNVALFDFLVEKKKKSFSKYYTLLPLKLKKMSFMQINSHMFYKNFYKNLLQLDLEKNLKNDHLVDREINFKMLLNVIFDLLILYKKRAKLKSIPSLFSFENENIDFKYLLEKDFINSLIGKEIVKILFYNQIIKNYLIKNNSFQIGLYPMENQPWETLLVYNWKKFKNDNIFGVIHTTVRFWDLRMYFGKYYQNHLKILPKKILSNSHFSSKNLKEGGFNQNFIIEVEALRYLNLYNRKIKNPNKSILICGDFNKKVNKQLVLLNKKLISKYYVKFLPHPTDNYNYKFPNVVNRKINDLIKDFEIVITSSISSSAVDAYETSRVVFQLIEDGEFNFSPLRGFKDVFFFYDPEDIIKAIENENYFVDSNRKKYFLKNKNLIKWEKFFQNLKK